MARTFTWLREKTTLPESDFSVALADADGRSEAIAGLLVSRSIGQQRCPINGGTDGLGHALNRSIHRGDTRRASCRRIRCEAGEKNIRTLGAGWLRPRPVFKKRYSATQMAGREPVEPVPRQYWPEALRRTRVGRLRCVIAALGGLRFADATGLSSQKNAMLRPTLDCKTLYRCMRFLSYAWLHRVAGATTEVRASTARSRHQ